MQAEVRAALEQTLGGLQFCRYVPRLRPGPTILQFVPLSLLGERHILLPEGTTIIPKLVDYKTVDLQRAQTAREHRVLLEFLVRLMSAPVAQWNAFYDDLWQSELMQRLRDPFESHGSMYADQRSLVEKRDLPTFLLSMAAEDLSESDFDLCYQFLTAPSSQVLSSDQQLLLDRVNHGLKKQQIVVELGLQLSDYKPTEESMTRLQRLLERLESVDRNDPLEFPVKFKITTLWFSMSAFAMPCNLEELKDLSSISGISVQNSLTNQCDTPQERWADSLEDFSPRVLLDPSVRSLDLSWLTLTGQHVSSVCSALRATSHVQEVSFMRRYAPDLKMHKLTQKSSGPGSRSESCTWTRARL